MIRTSFKHLRRTPGKALLFVLLLAGATMLLIFGAQLLVQTTQKIDAAEAQFTTIATVEQVSTGTKNNMFYDKCQGFYSSYTEMYDDPVSLDALNFEGANYINPPENRPYYLSEVEGKRITGGVAQADHIIEFTALEDQKEADQHIRARVEKVHFEALHTSGAGKEDPALQVGEEITICQHYNTPDRGGPTPIEAGRRYIAHFMNWSAISVDCEQDPDVTEYVIVGAPYTTQCDIHGQPVESGLLGGKKRYRADEVNEEFYESGMWEAWQRKIEYEEKGIRNVLPVIPTNSLQLLPAYHDKKTYLQSGREITAEEFQSGARVCMVSYDFALNNILSVGDKLDISMLYAEYGYEPDLRRYRMNVPEPLNAEGEFYEPFWNGEYEVVGIYQFYDADAAEDGVYELTKDTIIVPSASIEASDEDNITGVGPLQGDYCTFQIENGTASEFNELLYAHVPNMSGLTVTYKDNGYSEVMSGLQKTRLNAALLFAVGLLASIAIVALLLYFFIVREKKRTAIERSLGMSRRQCRTSLLAGIMVLSLLGTALGSGLGALLLNWKPPQETAPEPAPTGLVQEIKTEDYAGFDTSYSLWARNRNTEEDLAVESLRTVELAIYLAAPVALLALILLLAELLVSRSLKIEPILLLSGETE